MGIESIPKKIRERYHIEERGHACAILAADFPSEFADILGCLRSFALRKSHILTPGGGRSPISAALDGFLHKRGWHERSFNIQITIDGDPVPIPTHKIDNFRNSVGLEVEWNNKTEFYDRDLNNFRLLKDLKVLAAGVIITRMSELQNLFDQLGKGASYGASTNHWDKLIPKVDGGGAGGCPLLLIGMGLNCYDPDS
jgi:Restriction endonuclease BglII